MVNSFRVVASCNFSKEKRKRAVFFSFNQKNISLNTCCRFGFGVKSTLVMQKIINSIKKSKTKLGKWFWVLPAVLLIVVWRVAVSGGKATKIQVVQVAQGDLTETVSTSGTVKADQYSVLTFPSGGMVSWVGVKQGQKVFKGQGIAKLDTTVLNAAYEQALNNYRNYQALADSTLDSLQGHSTNETYAQRSTRTTAEVARDNAYDAVLAAKYNLQNAMIYAPFAGIVDTVSPSSPGINVMPGAANYTVVNPNSVYFSAEVEETDLPALVVGQTVEIKLDAYPDETLKGTLENIGVVAFTSSTGGNAYRVRVTLPQAQISTNSGNFKFKVGMKGDADVILKTIPNVMKLSSSAVVNDGTNNYVWVIESGKAKKKEVTLGSSSLDESEIISGLSVGQEVIDNPSSALKEGQRVSK